MNGLLYVALGGALGASGRYMLGGAMTRGLGADYPYGTLAANVFGGLLMGLLMGWLTLKTESENLRLFLAVGVLGGFTTFSAFSLETIKMIEERAYGAAAGYVSASVIFSVAAVFVGLIIARKVIAL